MVLSSNCHSYRDVECRSSSPTKQPKQKVKSPQRLLAKTRKDRSAECRGGWVRRSFFELQLSPFLTPTHLQHLDSLGVGEVRDRCNTKMLAGRRVSVQTGCTRC